VTTAGLGGDPSRAAPARRNAAAAVEEHRGAHPDGYGYSRYCELYRAWEGRLSPTMRQLHVASERMFVDYAGTTLEVVNGTTGEVRVCQLFVAAIDWRLVRHERGLVT
jgi:transposase